MNLPNTASLHVAFCGDVYNDYAILRDLERSGGVTDWPVPLVSRPGDRIAFYNVDLEKAFVGTAEVVAPKSDIQAQALEHGRMLIGKVRMLNCPVSIGVVRARIPGWKWTQFTRNAVTVPLQFVAPLWQLLKEAGRRRSNETASKAKDIFGTKLYQTRARKALPLLVSLAVKREKIYYDGLAEVMGISNPRLLNYVLGCVGQTLLRLGSQWGVSIPPLQCLVINHAEELPGEGVSYFISQGRYDEMSAVQKREIVDAIHEDVWSFTRWPEVLRSLQLEMGNKKLANKVQRQSLRQGGGFGDPEHNKKVELAAVGYVKRFLRAQKYKVVSREQQNLGFDLEATKGSETLFVEVKGVSGTLRQFVITAGEFNFSGKDHRFYLYLITDALSRHPKHYVYSGGDLQDAFKFIPTGYRAILK